LSLCVIGFSENFDGHYDFIEINEETNQPLWQNTITNSKLRFYSNTQKWMFNSADALFSPEAQCSERPDLCSSWQIWNLEENQWEISNSLEVFSSRCSVEVSDRICVTGGLCIFFLSKLKELRSRKLQMYCSFKSEPSKK
jgi:hypothetical protein